MASSEVSAAPPPRRTTRSFSFHSDRSNRSNNTNSHRQSVSRVHETAHEKESHRLHSKADPTLAMNEAEPSAVAAGERSSLAPLRAIQHRDVFGNPIAEPDKSNPTRNRWERPLDTIRSFEAAIEGPYAQRASARNGSEADWNRRESYYTPRSVGPSRPPSIYSSLPNPQRHPQDGYPGNQPSPYFNGRPSPPQRDSYHEPQQAAYGLHSGAGGHGGYSNGGGVPYSNRPMGSRSHLSPQYNGNRREPNDVYTLQNRDHSYETVTSATGSGTSGDQGSYRTDPSSDNNSIERASPPKPPVPAHDYGIGFNNMTVHQPAAFTVDPARSGSKILKKPVPSSVGAPPTGPSVPSKGQADAVPGKPPKRKSWLFRRFSKNT